MNNRINKAKVNAVVDEMEKMLGKDIKNKNRNKFERADWNQLTENKKKLKSYMKNEFEHANLTAAEIAEVSRVIQNKAKDPAKDSMFKVLKNKRHFSGKLSDTYVNLIADLETEQQQASSRIIIMPVDDFDNVTRKTFDIKAANAGIRNKEDWKSNDQIWLVKRDDDGNVQGRLVEYDPDNPQGLTVVCTLDTDEKNFNGSDLAIAKQVEHQLNSRMQMMQFLPEMALADNKKDTGIRQGFFNDTENYKNLRNEPVRNQKFAISEEDDLAMMNMLDDMLVEQGTLDNTLQSNFKEDDLDKIKQKNMRNINDRMKKNSQVITSP
ncbi:MAG: hypothetical protein GY821_16055 [Gammaproteobacteria bacterium]|nr:hypothetical protein [Gammaproteobacteria bacterium]